MTDRAVSSIWIVDADGANHRPLLSGDTSYDGQVWSPGGDRLAYVKDTEGRGSLLAAHQSEKPRRKRRERNSACDHGGNFAAEPLRADTVRTPTLGDGNQRLSLIHI